MTITWLMYFFVSVVIIISYVILMVFILSYWQSEVIGKARKEAPRIPIFYTVLIAVRNEELNIVDCLTSILENENFDLNRLEIIVVDDFSTDNTVGLIKNLSSDRIKVLELKDVISENINAYKKAALGYGFQHANGDYIIQFDGDVHVPPYYFETIDTFLREADVDFVACPVVLKSNDSVFQNFQHMDFLGLMAITQAGILSKRWFMANGANMVYKKTINFYASNNLASGDDIYGIQVIAQNSDNNICFLKNRKVTVSTCPKSTVKEFINQRIRWATKNKLMNGKAMRMMMVIPFLNAMLLLVHAFLIMTFGKIAVILLCLHLTVKMSVDYILLKDIALFFNTQRYLRTFISAFFMHVLYILGIGLASLFIKKYNWKGRKVY